MSNAVLCSFFQLQSPVQDATMISIVNVLLGISESEADVKTALEQGPMNFLQYLSGTSLAAAIADVICRRANDGHSSVPVESSDVESLIEYYLEARFHTSSAHRIGVHGAYNFQRLIYNTCACVVASYCRLFVSGNKHEYLASLRRAVVMVAEFADAIKRWIPVAPYVGGWWTKWHVLVYAIEMTTGTVLCETSPFRICNMPPSKTLAFYVFCDTIMERVLDEWDGSSVTNYKSSSFAWCSCSKAWQKTLGNHPHSTLTPNSIAFLSISNNVLNPPFVEIEYHTRPASPSGQEDGGAKRKYESPSASRVIAPRVASRVVGQMAGTKRFIAL